MSQGFDNSVGWLFAYLFAAELIICLRQHKIQDFAVTHLRPRLGRQSMGIPSIGSITDAEESTPTSSLTQPEGLHNTKIQDFAVAYLLSLLDRQSMRIPGTGSINDAEESTLTSA